MRLFFLSVVALLTISCASQEVEDIPVPSDHPSAGPTSTPHTGYPRFTTTDKPYLGCWMSVERSEVVEYKKFDIEITESSFRDSRFDATFKYSKVESNEYRDYFVLQISSRPQRFFSINMVSDNEMTIAEYRTRKDISDGESTDYSAFEKTQCKTGKKSGKR